MCKSLRNKSFLNLPIYMPEKKAGVEAKKFTHFFRLCKQILIQSIMYTFVYIRMYKYAKCPYGHDYANVLFVYLYICEYICYLYVYII